MRRYCSQARRQADPQHHLAARGRFAIAHVSASTALSDAMRAGELEVAAKHAGVLAHFLEDSTCPAHALIPADSALQSMSDRFAPPDQADVETAPCDRAQCPGFRSGRTRAATDWRVRVADRRRLLERCYVIVRGNRENLETLVKAIYAGDEATVDRMRRDAARRGAELLADAYYSAFLFAGEGPQ